MDIQYAGVLLLITWIFVVRSTLASIGGLGVALMLALFAAVIWWVVSEKGDRFIFRGHGAD